jgi:predicted membrane chloride channel (bestrophin family)
MIVVEAGCARATCTPLRVEYSVDIRTICTGCGREPSDGVHTNAMLHIQRNVSVIVVYSLFSPPRLGFSVEHTREIYLFFSVVFALVDGMGFLRY